MTLGQLRDLLASVDPQTDVRIERDGQVRIPDGIESWRGVYAEATLDNYVNGSIQSAERLLADVDQALGGWVFQGYKGGDYTYDRSTPVWADSYGESSCYGFIGHRVENGVLYLTAVDLSDYR